MTPNRRQAVSLSRDCAAVLIPEGSPITLQQGTEVHVTQALGGSVTVLVHGNLARIAACDADAVGLEPSAAIVQTEGLDLQGAVWEVLRTCYDPEIPINIVELGLVYGVQLRRLGPGTPDTPADAMRSTADPASALPGPSGARAAPLAQSLAGEADAAAQAGAVSTPQPTATAQGMRAEVVMTLTAPGCGMGDILVDDVRQKLLQLPGIAEAQVELTFDPPWHQGLMSEAARLQTGLY